MEENEQSTKEAVHEDGAYDHTYLPSREEAERINTTVFGVHFGSFVGARVPSSVC